MLAPALGAPLGAGAGIEETFSIMWNLQAHRAPSVIKARTMLSILMSLQTIKLHKGDYNYFND